MRRTYILYSYGLNKYYVGSTSDIMGELLRRHNLNHKEFTGKSHWTIVYKEISKQNQKLEREKHKSKLEK